MANSSPPWADYHVLMECCLVALDKLPGVYPIGIGEMIHRATTKLVMRETGDLAKMVCGSFQLCAGFEAGIERTNHSVTKQRKDKNAPASGKGDDKES